MPPDHDCCACGNAYVPQKFRPHLAQRVSFHKFPLHDHDRLQIWIQMSRQNGGWHPKDCHRLCSDHFEEKFIDRSGRTVRLMDDAIPTLHVATISKPARLLTRNVGKKNSSHLRIEDFFEHPGGVKTKSGAKDCSDLQIGSSASNNERHISASPESIKQESEDSNDQDIFVKSEPSCLESSCDPLYLDARAQLRAADEEIADVQNHLWAKHLNMNEKSFGHKNGFKITVDFDWVKAGSVKNVCVLPVASVASRNEDQSEFKEMLVVEGCMPIEDSEQVKEELFEEAQKTNAESCKEKINVIENVYSVGVEHICDVCSATFDNEGQLNSHKICCLLDWKPYVCGTCGERFWSKKLMSEHRLVHVIKAFKCWQCGWPRSDQIRKTRCSNCKCSFLESQSGAMKKRASTLVSESSEREAVKSKSEEKCEQEGMQKYIVSPKYCNQTDLEVISDAKSGREHTQVVVTFENSDQTGLKKESNRKRKQKRNKRDTTEEPETKCPTCERLFMSATDYRAHTQLVRCRKKIVQSAPICPS